MDLCENYIYNIKYIYNMYEKVIIKIYYLEMGDRTIFINTHVYF